ncbi:hypothetical protein OUZ56_009524 [Daphnia magna]|uniref:Uncharacterized protein n=1 Tax=Daphnia magna TaxID=35525 RepID=A0ABR0AGA4_9CRUS|nr:hypothetical protein OUZ56_009524 [Daphnia magna]
MPHSHYIAPLGCCGAPFTSKYCRNFGSVLGFMRIFKTRVKEMGARNSAMFVVGLPSSDKLWDDVPNMRINDKD